MLKNKMVSILLLIGLLGIGLFAGAVAFNGSPALAQTGENGEVEDSDDANEGPDVPITGTALEEASAAALEYIGEGRVSDTEVGDEEGFYEVEITRDNGSEVDVHLDEAFNVLGHEDE